MSTAQIAKVPTAKELFSQDDIKKKFQQILGKNAQAFMTSVLQVVGSSELLKKADPTSIYNAAAVAATLALPLNNSLGFAYIVPYNTKMGNNIKKVVAQFQIGYKGFIQLAQRSGAYKTISAAAIYEGQLVEENPLTGFVFDFSKKMEAGAKVVGYASFFRLVNGFEKTLYMTVDQVQAHGKRFSKSYANSDGLWKKDFESMALKTVLKLNLSKFGPMSIDMQKAHILDGGVINDADTMDVNYVDNEKDSPVDKETERILHLIGDAKSVADLEALEEHIPNEAINEVWMQKMEELTQPKLDLK